MIVKPNELRIGNYVMDAISKEWMVVDEIGKNIGAVLLNRDKYPLPKGWQMVYIPLNDEILYSFGFIKNNLDIWTNLDIELEIEELGEYTVEYVVTIDNGEYNIGKIFQFVHQLQNIYSSLFQEELMLKL